MAAHVARDPFDPYTALAGFAAGRTEAGALASFIGLCRGQTEGQAVAALFLDHYEGFTEAAMADLEAQARGRWALLDCLIIHRAGAIAPGEPIVLVATLSPHRAEALAATQFLIDALKTDAPFWKRETGPDGARWVEARAVDAERRAKW